MNLKNGIKIFRNAYNKTEQILITQALKEIENADFIVITSASSKRYIGITKNGTWKTLKI